VTQGEAVNVRQGTWENRLRGMEMPRSWTRVL
jgi:hypothetical protein